MGIRSVLKRIERAEAALEAQSVFSEDCICFPEKEQPFFCSAFEEPVAAQVKCPLHRDRFRQQPLHIYVADWRAEKEPARRRCLSAQYRKAWEATFPSELWPALPNEETEDGKVFFRLRDGSKSFVGECPR
jgi:hypothetical protein